MDGDEPPTPPPRAHASRSRAPPSSRLTWIHQTRRARDGLARVRDETRARVSARADCPTTTPPSTPPTPSRSAPTSTIRRRVGASCERESERAVEDRERQRHVDARLTRLEDAVAALTRIIRLEEKAGAKEPPPPPPPPPPRPPVRGPNRRWIRGYGNRGDVQSLRIRSEDAERERVRAVATKPRDCALGAFAAAGARAELADRRCSTCSPRTRPPMGALP